MRWLTRWRKSEEGGVFVMMALGVGIMATVLGVGVDLSRAQLVKSKLTTAIDSAGLASGTELYSSSDIKKTAQKFFAANFPDSYMGTKVSDFDVNTYEDADQLKLKVSANVDTSFMQIIGINKIPVYAENEITREKRGLEVVLVMDNTGSMGGGKIKAARQAGVDFLDIMYGNNESIPYTWIGVVPFTQFVKVGGDMTHLLVKESHGKTLVEEDDTDPATMNITDRHDTDSIYYPDIWEGCLFERTLNDMDVTDTPPSQETGMEHTLFEPFYEDKSLSGISNPNYECRADGIREMLPLNAEKSKAKAKIESMVAGNGHTFINTGLVWGFRALSPKWRGLWKDSPPQLPMDYGLANMEKVLVVMTDGENTMPSGKHTTYGWKPHHSIREKQLDEKTAAVCQNIKDAGITIYSITFQVNSSNVKNLFRNCASSPEKYYNSPSNEDLRKAFRKIADELGNLRVSQ